MEALFDTPVQAFLRTVILNNEFIYLDLWSVVHLFTGLIFGYFFARYFKSRLSWLVVLLLLIFYEIYEPVFSYVIFLPENRMDVVWDVVIGQIGFFISYYFFCQRFNSKKLTDWKATASD